MRVCQQLARSPRHAAAAPPSAAAAAAPARRRRPAAAPAAARPGRRRLAVRALGFDFGDGERDSRLAAEPPRPSPKAFAAYGLRAASLLVYQHVFKGAVGEALLALLSASTKYQGGNKEIISAFTKFYNLLMLSGYECFTDYVLDQVLLGRDNAFARAAAQGQVARGAPVMQAVAYDLDTLQGLSVSLETLAEYVGEVAPVAGSYWVSAASAAAFAPPAHALPTAGAPAQDALVVPGGGGGGGADGGGGGEGGGAGFVGPPPTAEELAAWRGALAGHDHWSAAAPLLLQYHRQHGFGITSRNAALRWSKGGFEEASEGGLARAAPAPGASPSATLAPPAAAAAGTSGAVLGVLHAPYEQLAANTAAFCAGRPAHHAVVCGPPGTGKSWLLWEGTLLAGRGAGLRVVDVPAAELPNVLDIARGCARYPRVRFVLVADNVELPLRSAAATELLAGLGGGGAAGWPANALLYVGASASSTVSRSDPVVSRCGLVVPLPPLDDEASYLAAVGELLVAAGRGGGGGGGVPAELREAAAEWGRQQGLSVRSAAAFVRTCGAAAAALAP